MTARKQSGLHPYCLGFGCFWAILLAALLGVAGIKASSSEWLAFVWVQQLACVASMPLLAHLLQDKLAITKPATAFVGGGALSLASFLYVWCFALGNSTMALSVVTGILLGTASAFFYLAWQVVYSNEGQARSAIYLSLSSALAVVLCLFSRYCPTLISSSLLVVLLPLGGSYALWRSAQDIFGLPARKLAPHSKAVLSDTWKPVLSGSAVCLIWSLASHIPALYDDGLVLSMLAGLGIACLLVAVLSLRGNWSGFGAQSAYQTLFPLIGIVLFIPALLGNEWLPFTIGFLTFGARLMMLLSFMLAAAYTARTQFSPMTIYMVCAWPLHLSSLVGDTVGSAIAGLLLSSHGDAFRIPALCLVVCFAAFVVTSLGKRAKSLAEPADDTLLINPEPAAAPLAKESCSETSSPQVDSSPYGLSERELEVVELLLKGNTIAAIASKLFISENTVRGRMKRIYSKLDVHSRQELVDLLSNQKG